MVLKTADSKRDDLSEGVVFAEDLPLGGAGIEFGEPLEIEDPRQEQAKEKEKQALSVRQMPARVVRNLGYGVAGLAEGLFDPFAGLGKALSTSGDIKQLMGVMKDPEASRERKVRAYDQIRELEKLPLSDNRPMLDTGRWKTTCGNACTKARTTLETLGSSTLSMI